MKIKTIIVDDNVQILNSLKNHLVNFDYIDLIHSTLDSEDFLEVVLEEKPDLVIMDIDMPRLNGIELGKILREKWTTHVLLTQDRVLYLHGAEIVSYNWHKMHCKDYGFRYYKIFFRFTNDPRFESKKELSKRKSEFIKEFDSYRLEQLQEYRRNQQQIKDERKMEKIQKKAAKTSK